MKTLSSLMIILITSYTSKAISLKFDTGKDKAFISHKLQSDSGNRSIYFSTKLHRGDAIGNVFSRTITFTGTEFKDSVRRVSGTCIYKVIDNDPLMPAFSVHYNYDGLHKGTSQVKFLESGGKTNNMENQVIDLNTDASGILFNSLVWGEPPLQLKKGTHWAVKIPVPWELGGAGVQKVTVLELDSVNHVIKLQREGTSDGRYDHDASDLLLVSKSGQNLRMTLKPGPNNWTGITVIKDGMIISDELMSQREITLTSGDINYRGSQREYIILNQMPVIE